MDLKIEESKFPGPAIRTSDPTISIVPVPSRNALEDYILFFYKAKKIVFWQLSDRIRLHGDNIEVQRERNPDLDMIFTDVGRQEVFWRSSRADVVNKKIIDVAFTIKADTDLGNKEEFEEMTQIFFEMMQWMQRGVGAMFRGTTSNEKFPFRRIRVGFDIQFLEQLKFENSPWV